MRRREFIGLVVGGAIARPLTAQTQEQGRTYRIGFLLPTNRQSPPVQALFDELRLNGFIEGQNLVIVSEGFEATDDRLAERAQSLIDAKPDVIVSGPELPLRTLQKLTQTVPLVGMTEDMVGERLVASLARPGGNITGITLLSPELDGKRQDILIEALPGARKIAALSDSKVTSSQHLQALQRAAQSRGIQVSVFGVRKPDEIAAAIDAAKAAGAEAANFLATPLFSLPGTRNFQFVMERVNALRLPSIFQWPETAEAGAVLGYGPRFTDMYRQRAQIVAKVLRGTKPFDIPVEQPNRYELVVNLKAAQVMGCQLASGLVLRADKLIE
jgi:putative ABC transport system substrate-binding protein